MLSSSCSTASARLLILNYHRVGRPNPEHRYRGMFVSPEHLHFQVSLLQRRGYKFTTVAHAVSGTHAAGTRLACITFDDGYEDNYLAGFPVLQSLGVPASLYMITADAGKKNVLWEESGESARADLLSWHQLASLQAAGWEIGSHAHHHVHLGRYNNDQQQELIIRSCELLEHNLGQRPTTFAYPYGHFNQLTPQLLAACGFKAALTTEAGINPLPLSDCLRLKRIPGKGFSLYHYPKWYWQMRRFFN